MSSRQEDEARSVLLETLNILGVFSEQIVVVGGWVPDLLYPGKQHIGSIDVDLAVAPGALGENAYSTIPNGLVEDAVEILRHKFAQLDSIGPVQVAEVMQQQGENVAQSQQSAFQYLRAMLQVIS